MGKYNLGKSITSINPNLKDSNLYVNEVKANGIVKDINKQLESIRLSLININVILNKSVKDKMVTGTRATAYRGWAKKCKSQSLSSTKVKDKLNEKYAEDVKNYPIKLLDERIAELEKKIALVDINK